MTVDIIIFDLQQQLTLLDVNVFKLIHPDVSGLQVNLFVESVYFHMVQCIYKQRFLSLKVLSLRDNFFCF